MSPQACFGSLEELGGLAADAEEQIKYFNEGKVYAVQIETTDACPQGCIYCYAESTPQTTKTLTSDEIRGVIKDAADMEVRMIDWLGGDPLVRKDWYELMKYALDNGLRNNIWTSGYPLRDIEIAKKAVEVSKGAWISVHVDSINDGIYQSCHRPKNSIEIRDGILNGVENVQSLGKNPDHMINCITYTKMVGPEDARRTMDWFWKKKGMRTCLTLFNPAGSAEKHPEWEPSLEEIKEAYEWRNKINYSDSEQPPGAMDVNKFYCGGMLCVTFEGDVTSCSVIREGAGNIRKEGFKAIVEKNKDKLLLMHLHDPKNLKGHCATCEHNKVCWGCRSSAHYYTGDEAGIDPKCWINPDSWKHNCNIKK